LTLIIATVTGLDGTCSMKRMSLEHSVKLIVPRIE